jgi:hypothetical protein
MKMSHIALVCVFLPVVYANKFTYICLTFIIFQTAHLFYVLTGSYKCRVGWAIDDVPRMVFKNVVAKPKTKKAMVIFFLTLLKFSIVPNLSVIPAVYIYC